LKFVVGFKSFLLCCKQAKLEQSTWLGLVNKIPRFVPTQLDSIYWSSPSWTTPPNSHQIEYKKKYKHPNYKVICNFFKTFNWNNIFFSKLLVGNNPARPSLSSRLWASKPIMTHQGSQDLSLQGTSVTSHPKLKDKL